MISKLKNKINSDIHLKEILTGSAVTFVLKMSGMLLGYVVILIISSIYGAEGVGLYNLTLSILMFVSMIATLGIDNSILRYVGEFNKNTQEYKLKLLYRYVIELTIPLSIVIAIVLYYYAKTIALEVFKNQNYINALQWIALITPFMVLQNISIEFIRGLKKLKVSEYLRSVNRPLINIILLLVLEVFIDDKLLPFYTLGVSVILGAVYAYIFVQKHIRRFTNKKIKDLIDKRELVKVSLPMMVTTIASFVMGNISLFFLEIYSTTENVGIFSIVLKIVMLISLPLIIVNTVLAPKFSELYWDHKYNELQRVINHSLKLIFLNSLLIAIFIILFREQILTIFGSEFTVGDMALFLLVIGQMINAMTGSVGTLLNMVGKQKILASIVTVSMLINILANIYLIPKYTLIGASISILISDIVINLTAVLYVKNKLNFITYYIPNIKFSRN
jgi:O-antigen/teichoic acid export membrane protein